MSVSKVIEQMRDAARDNYIRVLQLHEAEKASRNRLAMEHGIYIGMEKAYQAIVSFEYSQNIESFVNEQKVK